jgi:lysylphosphatidylglycerol synthetase-like protein (DUF2156 family)
MNTFSRRLLFWTPRAISIAFAVFLSLFALDVFGEGYGFGKTLLALLIHLVPVFIVLVVLAKAWRWEWIGAAGFAGLAMWYTKGNWRRQPDWVVTIAGPLLVIAALFLVNWLKHDELRARP